MKSASRRQFLAASLALPAAARGAIPSIQASDLSTPKSNAGAFSEGSVQYRTLGRTGLKISAVGCGCMITSDSSVIERAVDMGINHFDTARIYQRGNNEHMVGAALKSRRKQIILASKTLAADKAGALQQLDQSLEALSTGYLDIWYLHDKRRGADITNDLIEAQQIAKEKGKIRFAGLSLHSGYAEDVIPTVIRTGKIDVVLITYNFAMGDRWDALLASLAEAKIGVIAMKVIAGSLDTDPGYDYRRSHEILKRPGAPLAALKWVLQNPHVHCAIPSMKDMEQLEENVRAMNAPFTDADKKVLAAQLERIRPFYCRMCGECEGACPRGLPVADILRFLNYADGYRQYDLGRESYVALSEDVRAVRCSSCRVCQVNCPYGVQVAQRLSRAQELLA
jgi:predicted aldo/keto reductase-like oxidoreductase